LRPIEIFAIELKIFHSDVPPGIMRNSNVKIMGNAKVIENFI